MRRSGLFCVLAAGLALVGFAADPPAPPSPQSGELEAAKAKYEEAVAKAQKELDQAAAAARKSYVDDLAAALKTATKAENLDEAVRIRGLKELVEQERDGSAPKASQREGAITFEGSQYKIVLAEGGWQAAREKCQKLGGDLAVLDTKEKREFLGRWNGTLELWVGVSKDKSGKWKWVNGQAVGADAWEKGRPSIFGGYAVMFPKAGTLGDCKEDHPYASGFVCEWKK